MAAFAKQTTAWELMTSNLWIMDMLQLGHLVCAVLPKDPNSPTFLYGLYFCHLYESVLMRARLLVNVKRESVSHGQCFYNKSRIALA